MSVRRSNAALVERNRYEAERSSRVSHKRVGLRPLGVLSRIKDHYASLIPREITLYHVLFLVSLVVLLIFGLFMVYSASAPASESSAENHTYTLVLQVAWIAIGSAFAAAFASVDYHRFYKGKLLVIVCIAILILLIWTRFFSPKTKGAYRWFYIPGTPVSFQPSEFAKITILLVVVSVIEKWNQGEMDIKQLLGTCALGVIAPLVMVLIQPDKGTTATVVVSIFVMLHLAGVDIRILLAAAIILFGLFLAYSLLQEYSRDRIMILLNPRSDPLDKGYQLLQSWYAFGKGGLFGVGLGLSSQKYGYLPEAHNDFIFSVMGEELGFVGCVLFLVLFTTFIYSGLRLALRAADQEGLILATGAMVLLGFQFLVNICSVLGLIPMTGKPLPFISYGGSSVLSCMILVGMVASVILRSDPSERVFIERRKRMHLVEDATDSGSSGHLTLVEGKASLRHQSIEGAADRLRPTSRTSRQETPVVGHTLNRSTGRSTGRPSVSLASPSTRLTGLGQAHDPRHTSDDTRGRFS